MDSNSSNNYSYEDDFEPPDVDISQFKSIPVSMPIANKLEHEDLIRARVYKTHNIRNIHKSSKSLNKKTFKQLEKENKILQTRLNDLNAEISRILDKSSINQPKHKINPRDIRDANKIKQQIYTEEWNYLKHQIDKTNDPMFLSNLKKEITKKENFIKNIEKNLKKLKKSQVNQAKDLSKILVEDFIPYDFNNFGHLSDILYSYKEKIYIIKNNQEKDHEAYEKLYEKELDLNEKIEKLEELWKYYDITVSDSQNLLKEKYDSALKNLKKIETQSENLLNRLKAKEKNMKSELKWIKKETKNISSKIEIKKKENDEYEIKLNEILNGMDQNNLGHFSSLIKLKSNQKTENSLEKQNISLNNQNNLDKDEKLFSSLKEKSEKLEKNNDSNISFEKDSEAIIEPLNDINSRTKKITGSRPKNYEKETHPESIEDNIKKTESFIKPSEESKNIPETNKKIEKNIFSKPSLFSINELEPENSFDSRATKLFTKPLIFDELDPKSDNKPDVSKPNVQNSKSPPKSSLFEELEASVASNKPSIFKELELETEKNPQTIEPLFKPLKIAELNSRKDKTPIEPLFKPLNPIESDSKKDNEPTESFFKSLITNEPDFKSLNQSTIKTQDPVRPRGRDRSHLIQRKEEDTPKMFSFSPIKAVPDLKISDTKSFVQETENLFKGKTEMKELNQNSRKKNIINDSRSLEKLKSMAENAEKNNFFSNYFENPVRNPPINLTSNLHPIKPSSNSKISTELKSDRIPNDPKAVIKTFELEEEDLIL